MERTHGTIPPGALYVPSKHHGNVVAVRCNASWIFVQRLALHQSREQDVSVLCNAMQLRPGQLFRGVFETSAL